MEKKQTNHWLILVLLALAQFMVVLDVSVVNVALPAIQRAFHISTDNLQWIVTAYTLTFGGFLLLGGRAADLFGRKRMFLTGVALFVVASLFDGLAQSGGMLIGLRALQGFAGALMSPAALSIVLVTYTEGHERNRALSVWGAVASGGAAAGVLLGGILTQYLNWRWNFFVNVPVGILVFLTAMYLLPKHESEAGHRELDLFGALSVTAGMMLLVYTIVKAPAYGWTAGSTLAMFAASIALLAVFIVNEQRVEHPLIPLSIFRIRNVAGADAMQVLNVAGLFSMFFFASLYLQGVLHYSPVKTGVSFLAVPIVIAIAATNTPKLIQRFGYKPLIVLAPLFVAGGLLYMAQVPVHGSYWVDVLPALILVGFMGFNFVGVTIAATAGVPRTQSGLASGLLNTSQQVGGALGLAILNGVNTSRMTHLLHKTTVVNATVGGYHAAFYAAAGFAVASSVLGVVVIKSRVPDAEGEATTVVTAGH